MNTLKLLINQGKDHGFASHLSHHEEVFPVQLPVPPDPSASLRSPPAVSESPGRRNKLKIAVYSRIFELHQPARVEVFFEPRSSLVAEQRPVHDELFWRRSVPELNWRDANAVFVPNS